MVVNGDVLSGADLAALLDSHASLDANVTLHLVRVGDPRAFGCVPTDLGRGIAPPPALGHVRGRNWCTTVPRCRPGRC
jgi:hypothetical protein